jgi:hypothetical protein
VQDIAAEVAAADAAEVDFLGGEVNEREADGNPDDLGDGGELHFVHIKNLDRLLGIRGDYTVCVNCMQQFTKGAPIAKHEANCSKMPAQVIKMPVNDPVTSEPPELKFYPGRKQFKNAIIGFCDFEAANFICARKVPGKKERRKAGTANRAAAAVQSFTAEGLAATADENAATEASSSSSSSSVRSRGCSSSDSGSGSDSSSSSSSSGEEDEDILDMEH